ncbi:MAG: hypothetical protein RL226_705, partial [Bacteroidota bacterium]
MAENRKISRADCRNFASSQKRKKMKSLFTTLFLTVALIIAAQAQPTFTHKPLLAVGDIDINMQFSNPTFYPVQEHIMIEMSKNQNFELLDKYDMLYLIKRDGIQLSGCYSKICLIEIGKQLNVDKMLTGSILELGDNIVVNFRLIDVASGKVEMEHTAEYLQLQTEIKQMVVITLAEMFEQPVDEELRKKLTVKNDYESSFNNPYQLRLRSDGPRMGFTVFQGNLASRLAESTDVGGFDASPVMFQFGYQFEKQYLNEGNFQALFEFIPMMTGLDQGLFIPSVTVMNGLRNNKNGLEFAFGPTFSVVPLSHGYFDETTGAWVRG